VRTQRGGLHRQSPPSSERDREISGRGKKGLRDAERILIARAREGRAVTPREKLSETSLFTEEKKGGRNFFPAREQEKKESSAFRGGVSATSAEGGGGKGGEASSPSTNAGGGKEKTQFLPFGGGIEAALSLREGKGKRGEEARVLTFALRREKGKISVHGRSLCRPRGWRKKNLIPAGKGEKAYTALMRGDLREEKKRGKMFSPFLREEKGLYVLGREACRPNLKKKGGKGKRSDAPPRPDEAEGRGRVTLCPTAVGGGGCLRSLLKKKSEKGRSGASSYTLPTRRPARGGDHSPQGNPEFNKKRKGRGRNSLPSPAAEKQQKGRGEGLFLYSLIGREIFSSSNRGGG